MKIHELIDKHYFVGNVFTREAHDKISVEFAISVLEEMLNYIPNFEYSILVIKIQEFQDRVDEMTEMYKMQTGSTSLPEEYQTQIRQSVFDGMVQDIVLKVDL